MFDNPDLPAARGHGCEPHFATGDDPATVHRLLADTLDEVMGDIAAIQRAARRSTCPPGGRPV